MGEGTLPQWPEIEEREQELADFEILSQEDHVTLRNKYAPDGSTKGLAQLVLEIDLNVLEKRELTWLYSYIKRVKEAQSSRKESDRKRIELRLAALRAISQRDGNTGSIAREIIADGDASITHKVRAFMLWIRP